MDYICVCFLGICAVFDYRTKTIPVWVLWTFGLLGIVFRVWQGSLFSASVLMALGIGFVLWIVGKCTGKIGEGDGLMYMVLGIYVGATACVQIFFWAVLMTAILSLVLLIGKKGTLHTEIPLAPFLLVSFTVFQVATIVGI